MAGDSHEELNAFGDETPHMDTRRPRVLDHWGRMFPLDAPFTRVTVAVAVVVLCVGQARPVDFLFTLAK